MLKSEDKRTNNKKMSQPRQNSNSYMTREYSVRSQITNEMLANDNKYLNNEPESQWGINLINNSETLPTRFINRNLPTSLNRASNLNSMTTSSINYQMNEPDLQWKNNNNRFESRLMTDLPSPMSGVHNLASATMSPNINDNRDQFSIYGSFKKHISEKRDSSMKYDSTQVIETREINYKNLPVKQSTASYTSSEFEVPVNSALTSSGFFTPQTRSQQYTLQDILNSDATDSIKNQIVEDVPIKAETQNQNQNFSSLPEIVVETPKNEIASKDQEIKKLNKTIDKLNNKMKTLLQSNEEMKTHLKNLLNERKNLIKQIENSEFEEIIEEEEVQRAKPNIATNVIPSQQKSTVIKQELIKENYLEKSKISLQDLPQHILNKYRQEIIDCERDKIELEKRTLINTLNIQYQQQLQSLRHEQDIRKTQMKHVSIQSYKTKKFNQTVSEVNLSRSTPPPKSIGTVFQPATFSKQSQNDIKDETNKKLAKDLDIHFTNYIRRRQIKTTEWQNTILQQLTESLDKNNSEQFMNIIEEILFKSSKNILTSVQPTVSSKLSQNEAIEDGNKSLSREVSKSLNEYIRSIKMKLSDWQKIMLERFLKSLEMNDVDNLSSVIEEILLKQMKSVETLSQPATVSRLSQNDSSEDSNSKLANEAFTLFTTTMRSSRVTTTKWQESIVERLMNSLKTNNSQMLSTVMEELLFKPSRTIGINSVPDNMNKNSQTQQKNYSNLSHEVNIVEEKPKFERLSKSVSAKPTTFQKGIQPDEKFFFETGTMTDHLFFRSQGVNTLTDYSKNLNSPYSETDSFVTRTSSRNESKKEIKSHTVIQSSSSNLLKQHQKLQEKLEIKIEPQNKNITEEWNQTFLVKELKGSNQNVSTTLDNIKSEVKEETIIKAQNKTQETASKPRELIEEWEQNIEEKVQVMTAHVDKNQNIKDDTQTTVECWETISKIKDGKLIEKKECYRDKYVSSNPDEIRKHLESHEHNHSHSNFEDKNDSGKSVETHKHFHQNEEHNEHQKNTLSNYGNSRLNTKTSSSSFNVPVIKGFEETEISKFRNYTNLGVSRKEVSSIVEQLSNSQLKENHSISERIEQSSTSKSFNSPISFTSFSSISTNDKSNYEPANQRKIDILSRSSKPKVLPKPITIQNSESLRSSQGINVNLKTFSPTIESSEMYFDETENSTVIGSDNSAFYSISELPKPKKDDQKYDYQEVLLPENIFQMSSQVMLWLNTSKLVSMNNIEHMPQEMIKPCLMLIDWWVDMVIKLSSNQLLTTVQYLISTFNKNFVKFLVINRDQQGNTCMHYIIGHQFWESFSVIYATGLVDPNIYNVQGFTVMMLAATLQVPDEILNNHIRKLADKADLNLQSKEHGQTAIYLSALHDNDNTITTLYALGADINIRDSEENTPLMIATIKNNIKAVKAILACPGVLLELKNKDGNSALKLAEQNNFSEISALFTQRRSIRRSEISGYSKILSSNSNPISPRTFRKYTYN